MSRWLLAAVLVGAAAGLRAQELIPIPAVFKPDPLKKAEAAFQRGDWPRAAEEAGAALERMLDGASQAKAYWLLGKSQEALGGLDKALSVYQLAVKLHPRDTRLLLAQADLFMRVGLEDRAVPLYESVLKIRPTEAQAHLGLGTVHLQQGLLALAVPEFKDVLDSDPASVEAARGLAQSLAGLGKPAEAERILLRALERRKDAGLWAVLAEVQRRRGARSDGVESMRRAVAAAPERLDLRLRHAFWLLADGRVEDGAAAAREALKLDPDDVLARFALGVADLQRGDRAAAARHFEPGAVQTRHPFIRDVASRLREQAVPRP